MSKKKVEFPALNAGFFWRVTDTIRRREYWDDWFVTLQLVEEYTKKSFFRRKPRKAERVVRFKSWPRAEFVKQDEFEQQSVLRNGAVTILREIEKERSAKYLLGDYK